MLAWKLLLEPRKLRQVPGNLLLEPRNVLLASGNLLPEPRNLRLAPGNLSFFNVLWICMFLKEIQKILCHMHIMYMVHTYSMHDGCIYIRNLSYMLSSDIEFAMYFKI